MLIGGDMPGGQHGVPFLHQVEDLVDSGGGVPASSVTGMGPRAFHRRPIGKWPKSTELCTVGSHTIMAPSDRAASTAKTLRPTVGSHPASSPPSRYSPIFAVDAGGVQSPSSFQVVVIYVKGVDVLAWFFPCRDSVHGGEGCDVVVDGRGNKRDLAVALTRFEIAAT